MPSKKEEQKLKGVANGVTPNCNEFIAEDEGGGSDFGFQKAKMCRREEEKSWQEQNSVKKKGGVSRGTESEA
ncbi:hypothetical protein VNO78_02629 [Psophocarpus tetragonolobus]|uniref:Uncharacterized protein n=1 Tax=Psophocarpus tetragonolobus TaxID=3891 RepID=A0AAN9XVT2_PSOTE